MLLIIGCAHRYYMGPWRPEPEDRQVSGVQVLDDGTTVFTRERLEISLRPMTDEELNRQFAAYSNAGIFSTNPYTYGNWVPPGEDRPPQRFTVFKLKVKNYTYPKVLVDPSQMVAVAQNGRVYHPLTLSDLRDYYIRFVIGYAGNVNARYEERMDILKRTLYHAEPIFSGQEREGYVVFPVFHKDVKEVKIILKDVVLRSDYQGNPLETMDVVFRFHRKVEAVR